MGGLMSQKRKKATRIVVPTAVAAAVVAAALSINWSSGLQADPAQEKGAGSAQEKDARSAGSVSDDPATWRLPIEAYLPGPPQGVAGFAAATRDGRIDECMEAAGFADWEPAPDLPSLGDDSLTGDRYGVHDLEQVQKSGYHPDPDKLKAYNKALLEDHSMETDREILLECARKVDGRPGEALDVAAQKPTVAEEIAWYSYRDSKSDPTVLNVFTQWSACMKAKGYEYEAPMDANDDPQWATDGGSTQKEIETAVADVECRSKHHVAKVWFDAESTIQQKMIKRNVKALEQERKSAEAAQ
jgi:hypothetical protein